MTIIRKVDMDDRRQHPHPSQRARHAQDPARARGGEGRAPAQARPGAYRPAAPQQGAYRPAQPARKAGPGRVPGSGTRPKKKGGPWRVVFWIALVVLVASLVALGAIAFSYWQGQHVYDEVAEQGFSAPEDIEGTSLADLVVDWDALRAVNPDTVGWIYIPGSEVNYPIVHTTDNEYYLTHDFQGTEGWLAKHGAIFLAAENKGDFTDPNNLVYGHNMRDGSMFATITGMTDQARFDELRDVYILTPQGNYKLQTFSLVHCAADDPLAQMTFASEDERVSYVQDKIDRSVVGASGIPAAADMKKTFAFSTCDSLPSDGRYVLFAYVADSTVAASDDAGAGAADPDAVGAVDEAAKEMAS